MQLLENLSFLTCNFILIAITVPRVKSCLTNWTRLLVTDRYNNNIIVILVTLNIFDIFPSLNSRLGIKSTKCISPAYSFYIGGNAVSCIWKRAQCVQFIAVIQWSGESRLHHDVRCNAIALSCSYPDCSVRMQ